MRTTKTVTTITRSHSYTATVTEPTCTEAGYTTYTCTCGDSYQEDETAALGHDYTITNNGSIVTGTCTRCGHFYSSPIIGVDPPIRPQPPISTASYSAEATSDMETAECTVLSTVTQTYSYVYNGGQLMQEVITTETIADGETTTTTETLNFTYDAAGTPLSVTYDNATYYYVTNIQGDVLAIVNTSGTTVVQYTYDAWGNILSTSGSLSDTLGKTNPLRYRGYVYDQETGLYYLQSRYYDPEIGRFISSDVLVSTGQGLLGNNMFAYCNNNPINFVDVHGYRPTDILECVCLEYDTYGPNTEFLMAFYGVNSANDIPDMPEGAMVFVENITSVSVGMGSGIVEGKTVVMDANKYCEYTFVGICWSKSMSPPLDMSITQGYVYGIKDPADYCGLFVGGSGNMLATSFGGKHMLLQRCMLKS